jgi:hypothetical protein
MAHVFVIAAAGAVGTIVGESPQRGATRNMPKDMPKRYALLPLTASKPPFLRVNAPTLVRLGSSVCGGLLSAVDPARDHPS